MERVVVFIWLFIFPVVIALAVINDWRISVKNNKYRKSLKSGDDVMFMHKQKDYSGQVFLIYKNGCKILSQKGEIHAIPFCDIFTPIIKRFTEPK